MTTKEIAGAEKANVYDEIRKKIYTGGTIHAQDRIVMTRMVSALQDTEQGKNDPLTQLFKLIAEFDTFTEDNDPYKEHDFGSVVFDGEKYFFKFDDYNGHDNIRYVLTIMHSSEH